jgi:hypothetical protein
MSRLARLAVLAVVLLLGPALQDVDACSCLGPQSCDADRAQVLFSGKVIALWRDGDSLTAKFQVEKAIRGARSGELLAVATSTTSCGLPFRVGERWLVSAHHVYAPAGRTRSGRDTPFGTGACEGSGRIPDGDTGPIFPARSDIGGRITRFTNSMRPDGPRVAGVRVWVTTPSGVIESRTDRDGDFLLRDVPLDPARRLHVDLPGGEEIQPVRLGVWTPEACGLLSLVVRPVERRRAR